MFRFFPSCSIPQSKLFGFSLSLVVAAGPSTPISLSFVLAAFARFYSRSFYTSKMSKFMVLAAAAGFVQAYTNTDVSQFMMKNIDPIVMPGEYKSHMHSFFGSDVVTKDLPTSEELRAGCSTAKNPNNFSVYCTSLCNSISIM